ncbi:MAG: hypothetical protein ACK2UK_21970, partial [Candidatus Promineifilaceae bacterium]
MAQSSLRTAVRYGLIAGVVAASVSAIGMVETFNERDIISGVLSLGQILLFATALVAGYMAVLSQDDRQMAPIPALINGFVAGIVTAIPLIVLIFLTVIAPNIRSALVNVTPALIAGLTFGQGPYLGSLILAAVMGILGLAGAAFHLLPERIEKPLRNGVFVTLGVGLFSEILINILRPLLPRQVFRAVFGSSGITVPVAIVVFVATVLFTIWWERSGEQRVASRRGSLTESDKARNQRIALIVGAILVLVAPWVLGL